MSDSNLDAAVEFADNPEARCPCVILVDTSGSMQGDKINALNEGLKAFKKDLAADRIWRFTFDSTDLARVQHRADAIAERDLGPHHRSHREVLAVNRLAGAKPLVHFELLQVRGQDEVRALDWLAIARIGVVMGMTKSEDPTFRT